MNYQNRHYHKVARAIPTRTSIEEFDFKQLLTLVNDCLQIHEVCRSSRYTYPSLPTRIIDVGDEVDSLPYLLSPENESGRYAALTHCWGGPISCTTTVGTLQQRQKGIPLGDMPKTFREAVIMTRRLGIRYLWIDALCIIQDSADDWTREARQMAAIYAGSAITISPLNSNSSAAGIFNFQPTPEIQLDNLESPLNSRAWCLQERLFATAMLHVGREQMFFECLHYNVGEDGSRSHWATQLPADRYGPPSLIAHWYGLVYEFQRRNITMGSDKLPAISALAARFQERSGFHYVAGLFEEQILQGLCWGPYHPRLVNYTTENPYRSDSKPAILTRPTDRRIPSWSWASVNGTVLFKCVSNPDLTLVEFEPIDRKCVNDFVEPNPDVAITLTAKTARMYYRLPKGREHVGVLSHGREDTAPIVFDGCVLDVNRQTSCACTVVLMGYPQSQSNYWKSIPLTLMILEEEAQAPMFSRVGLCTPEIEKESLDEVLSAFERRTITLI
ncbi:HET-domain-containing protein [Dothidotthia symphoricarpi CBS 119687]|uniref:HET-domain-containing protein n=1 Tax=Dothidotthia symphoricarpi CBS 119687 TaxID=1392245 RepID=A0A6A6ASW3_9PLEO|nr:HET-domain-containing protein [Dothidotthia symphoricarpi CBS 119687]KAF2133641.1 HET-domain-containing protein [Dothidotthia symphoricarpi CBS 119687]